MISCVHGTVLKSGTGSAVIDVGGVGLTVNLTPEHAASLTTRENAFFYTSLIVREDALILFGFREEEELEVFALLLCVSGVGPKSALGVLAQLSPRDIADAVANEDDRPFRAVPGIGPKTAKLIAVSLAGKLQPPSTPQGSSTPTSIEARVLSALVGLGWPEKAANQAIGAALASPSEKGQDSVPLLLRQALAVLGSPSSSGGTS